MKSNTTTILQRTVRAALLAAALGTALATAPGAAAQNVKESRTVINSSNGENTARVEVLNGRYTILLNGKDVKSGTTDEAWTTFDLVNEGSESVGTVTHDNDEFAISLGDEDGIPVASASNAGQTTAYRHALLAERDAVRAVRAGTARAYAATALAATGEWGAQPKSMLGVTLESPGEALSSHLGINRETCTLLTSVSDGLPAAKAGLKLYDVITEVNGEPAAPDTLRRFLREKNAGDTLALKVFSGAVRKDVTVTLESYDAGRLNIVAAVAWSPGPASGGTFTINAFDQDFQEKARQLEELGRKLAEKSAALQSAGSDSKALEDLGEQMNKLGEEMNKRGGEMNKLAEEMARANTGGWNIFPGGQGGARTIIGRRSGPGGSMPFLVPTPATPPTGFLNPALPPGASESTGFAPLSTVESTALKQRMDKMDERLAKLVELMEISAKNQGTTASEGSGGSSAKKDN